MSPQARGDKATSTAMGVSQLQHAGSIKFLLKHKLAKWPNPTRTLWDSEQSKLGVLCLKHEILARSTPLTLISAATLSAAVQQTEPALAALGMRRDVPAQDVPAQDTQRKRRDHARMGFHNPLGISDPLPK